MADMIHMSLSNFRNTMLTAVACLECELRDRSMPANPSPHVFSDDGGRLLGLESSMDLLRRTILEFNHTLVEMGLRIQDVEQKVDLLAIRPNLCSENPIYTSQEATSYRYELRAQEDDVASLSSIEDIADIDEAEPAGADLLPEVDETVPVEAEPEPEIDEHVAVPSNESVHSISEEGDEEEVEAVEEASEEVVEESSDMEVLTLDGVDYYLDSDQNVFTLDSEAGEYTQVGTYDPEEGAIAFLTEETEEGVEEVEEAIEEVEEDPMEEFTYKGETYYRDGESNVYTLDAEAGEYTHIGTWNGKKIVKV